MEDFIHRTITFNSPFELFTDEGDLIQISVSRTVTSAGLSFVSASYGKQTIQFHSNESVQHALEFAKQIIIACEHECKLPIL